MKVDKSTGEVIQNERGHELPDPTPLEIPAGFKRPESLTEMVQRLVRTNLSRAAGEAGQETFEEAEDFEIDDFFDPSSPYEEIFDPVLGRGITPDEFRRNEVQYRQRYEAAQAAAWEALDRSEALRARRVAKQSGAPGGGPGARPTGGSAVAESDGSGEAQ